ncbi:hypothetical protein [Piscibacillus salipiscarius]|uniref:hypothetical protein n=1 Tax=Piscibacillus salipiscarius TaxID=299480 RepID=UPI00243736B4|nr:hypothetical protein [Piscibacillus salipiscarius]
MGQFILFLIGFGFTCVGGVSIIGYLNYLPAGMNAYDFIYLYIIVQNVICFQADFF